MTIALTFGLLAVLLAPPAQEPEPWADSAAWTLERADAAAVEALLREQAVERTLAEPGWTEYGSDLGAALARQLVESLGGWLRLSPGARAGVSRAAQALAVLVVVLALAWAVRAWLRRRRPAVLLGLGDAAFRPTRAAEERGSEAWGRELAKRLEGGEASGALEALWWWLATSITEGRVDPAWTSQELVLRSRRPQLLAHVRVLDRLTYGGRRPPLEDVSLLAARLREALA